MAVKATHCIINDKNVAIFKDPVTDNGIKKSAKGYLKVIEKEGTHGKQKVLIENCTAKELNEADNLLEIVCDDGIITKTSFREVRDRVDNIIKTRQWI